MTLLGKDARKACSGFLQMLPKAPFPLGDFAFYPFAVINFSPEDDHVLTPLRPPGDATEARAVLGRPKPWWQPWDSVAGRP